MINFLLSARTVKSPGGGGGCELPQQIRFPTEVVMVMSQVEVWNKRKKHKPESVHKNTSLLLRSLAVSDGSVLVVQV